MPPRAIANLLAVVWLLAGFAAVAAEAPPADGGTAATARRVGEAVQPSIAQQGASPTSNGFLPSQQSTQGTAGQPAWRELGSSRGGAATAGRDGFVGQQPGGEQVVPTLYQAPAAAASDAAVRAASPDVSHAGAAATAKDPLDRASATRETAAKGANGKDPAAAASAAPSGQSGSPPLTPRRGARQESSAPPQKIAPLSSLLTVGSSLAVVLGLFFVLAWLMRRIGPRRAAILPAEVVEVLGRSPLAGREQLHLLRFGQKLVLVCLGPDGARTLTEITDRDEATRLAGLCRQAQPNSTTAAFRQVFQQFHAEAGRAEATGSSGHEDLPLANAGFKPIQGGRLEGRDV